MHGTDERLPANGVRMNPDEDLDRIREIYKEWMIGNRREVNISEFMELVSDLDMWLSKSRNGGWYGQLPKDWQCPPDEQRREGRS